MTSEELASPGATDTNTAIYLKIPNIDTDTCKMQYIGVSKQRHLSIAIQTKILQKHCNITYYKNEI